MTRPAQKDDELHYVAEFLSNQLHVNVTDVKAALREPPDASVSITDAGGTAHFLDFEIAEYYVDDLRDSAGGSPSKRSLGCWERIYAALVPRLEGLRLPIDVNVRFKEPLSFKNKHVDQFVEELIRFAQEYRPAAHLGRTAHEVFPPMSYPLLNEYAERIWLTFLEGTVVLGWHCSNAGAACIGVVTSQLAKHIYQKSGKPYTWRSGAEKCLLLYASGSAVTSRAGPPPPDPAVWNDEELTAACKAAVFDRIYFWERVRAWYRRLK